MINNVVQLWQDELLTHMETTLAHLAMHWRGADNPQDAQELAQRYQSILVCMIDLGLDHPLDIDSELPDALMPPRYFEQFA